jgi:hypothetical protein
MPTGRGKETCTESTSNCGLNPEEQSGIQLCVRVVSQELSETTMASWHSDYSRVQPGLSIQALVKLGEEKRILPQIPEGAQPCGHHETTASVGIWNWKRVHVSFCNWYMLQLVTVPVGSSCLH